MHTVRPVFMDDLAQIAEIEKAEGVSSWSLASLEKELKVRGGMQLGAFNSSGQVLGWCAVRIIAPEAELLRITVGKNFRRMGVGYGLLRVLVGNLHGAAVHSLYLEVRSLNLPAIALYELLDFLPVGLRKAYYTNPDDDAVIMKLTF